MMLVIQRRRKIELKQIEIIYHDPNMPKLEFIEGKSDWIDLRARYGGKFKKGDFALIDLGVSMKLPEGYEAHIAPRSSSFRNFHFIQTNSIGIVDNSYSGSEDIWKLPCYFVEDSLIKPYDRICQFRIVKKMKNIEFKEVKELNEENRGGFGSSGVN